MTYDSPLSEFGGEVISEVASFIEEGLVILEGWDWEKRKEYGGHKDYLSYSRAAAGFSNPGGLAVMWWA